MLNDTTDLYRSFDCTQAAEFLFACVQRTVDEVSKGRREGEFKQLTDDEVQRIERIVADAFEGSTTGRPAARYDGLDTMCSSATCIRIGILAASSQPWHSARGTCPLTGSHSRRG